MYEVKQTSEIQTVKDIENRIYHAFAVAHLTIKACFYLPMWSWRKK